MFDAKILADSLSPSGDRLTTIEMTYPRIIHSEHLRHRLFAFNAASSRAIPVEKFISAVMENPFIPIYWGSTQKGMQAGDEVPPHTAMLCEREWLAARDKAVDSAQSLLRLGLHKQIPNRLLEPWMWTTVICTGGNQSWANFFKLRCHPDAEPHIRKIAEMCRQLMMESDTVELAMGDWHLPLVGFMGDEHLSKEDQVKVSAGRCARVSYLTHDGKRDVEADIALHDRLISSGHFSPTEHQAQATNNRAKCGNLRGNWVQYRKTLPNECAK